MKNTTPSPGRGWRWLRVGWRKRKGDEHNLIGRWMQIIHPGQKVIEREKHTYRRRVKKGKR